LFVGRRGNFSGLFTQDAPSVVAIESYHTDENIYHSCFVEGTQVAVEGGGMVPIEMITEGTLVLSDANHNAYGVASDEDVVNHATLPFVCGFSK
jgi:hypothetical protein